METTTSATVYLDGALHKALRLKAAVSHRSISEIVSDAVREALREDHVDLTAFDQRAKEKNLTYEQLLKKLKSDGSL
ncbi:MAG: CopG family transcriptional regulator [Stenotrophobium sp.]